MSYRLNIEVCPMQSKIWHKAIETLRDDWGWAMMVLLLHQLMVLQDDSDGWQNLCGKNLVVSLFLANNEVTVCGLLLPNEFKAVIN